TLGTTLALTFAHWLPWMCCVFARFGGGGSGIEDVALVQAGATPPAALAIFAFMAEDFWGGSPNTWKFLLFPSGGLGLWVLLGLVFWSMLHQRFCRDTNRDTLL